MTVLTVGELLERMPGAFLPARAGGIDAVVQLEFTGAEAGEWFVVIRDSTLQVRQGRAPAARLTLSADAQDVVRIFTGELGGMQAFLSGRLRISGDTNLAMRLAGLFKLP